VFVSCYKIQEDLKSEAQYDFILFLAVISVLSSRFRINWTKSDQGAAIPTWIKLPSLMEVDDSWGFQRLRHQ
jgi:hypothetical protein